MDNKSVNAHNITASPIITGSVGGNLEHKTENSFNTYTEQQKQNLAEAAAEIQSLLKQLEQSYPTDTTTEQMVVAARAIEQIESNPTWKQKAIAAFKQGSLNVIGTHPVGKFIVGAIQGWQEPKGN